MAILALGLTGFRGQNFGLTPLFIPPPRVLPLRSFMEGIHLLSSVMGLSTLLLADLDQKLQKRDEMINVLKLQLEKAQSRMKKTADTGRREVQFQVGDLVYLKLQPYRQRSLAEKLSPRFFGPYAVFQKIGVVAYKLQLRAEANIHLVFHVSQLRKAVGSTTPVQPLPTHLSTDLEWKVQPEAVLGIRPANDPNFTEPEVLIQWQGLPSFEAS